VSFEVMQGEVPIYAMIESEIEVEEVENKIKIQT
jgi:hypothetical protein